MELLEQIAVQNQNGSLKKIELYHGDLTNALPPEETSDFLVVSAFPDNYVPSYSSLVGSLKHKLDVSLQDLAAHKYLDLRATSSCWVSHPIKEKPFQQIVCFEPAQAETAPQVVGDIFRSLVPLINSPTTVCMPVVTAGNQHVSPSEILPRLLDAAVQWMSVELPLQQLKIVECRSDRATQYADIFRDWKSRSLPTPPPRSKYKYDVFISYCHADKEQADFLVAELKRQQPSIQIFIDRVELNPGAAWQQKIYEALDDCQRIVALLTPSYLKSKMCAEEINIALLHHHKASHSVLIPLYVFTAPLPGYLQLKQYIDCREGDESHLQSACKHTLADLNRRK